jgi:flagellar biosynthesis/type III secretory pathway chaperone
LVLARELAQVLEIEFQALQAQDLDRFEQLQAGKTDLLVELTRLCPAATELQTDPDWQDVREQLAQSRDAHRRNAVLIERKLEAIRGALQSLQASGGTSTVEVYDRLGQVARFSRSRGYQEA